MAAGAPPTATRPAEIIGSWVGVMADPSLLQRGQDTRLRHLEGRPGKRRRRQEGGAAEEREDGAHGKVCSR